MRIMLAAALLALPLTTALAQGEQAAPALLEKPAASSPTACPPHALATATRPIWSSHRGFSGWNARDRSMLISTRFGNTAQLQRVAMPMGAREQLSFEVEPVGGGWSPNVDVLGVQKMSAATNSFSFTLCPQASSASSPTGEAATIWAPGAMTALARLQLDPANGTDTDLYVVDPRDPSTDRLVAQVSGGGWNIVDFAPTTASGGDRIYRSPNRTSTGSISRAAR